MKNGVNWQNDFAIGNANIKNCPLFFRLMRNASLLLPSRKTFLSNGSSCIQEFLFEVRFYFSTRMGIILPISASSPVFKKPGIHCIF